MCPLSLLCFASQFAPFWVAFTALPSGLQIPGGGTLKHRKTMSTCFFDAGGIVHSEFVSLGQTADPSFHLEVLRRLCRNSWSKRPELWHTGDWFFHHDNTPARTALSAHQL